MALLVAANSIRKVSKISSAFETSSSFNEVLPSCPAEYCGTSLKVYGTLREKCRPDGAFPLAAYTCYQNIAALRLEEISSFKSDFPEIPARRGGYDGDLF